jgi:hypothetical protein
MQPNTHLDADTRVTGKQLSEPFLDDRLCQVFPLDGLNHHRDVLAANFLSFRLVWSRADRVLMRVEAKLVAAERGSEQPSAELYNVFHHSSSSTKLEYRVSAHPGFPRTLTETRRC